MDKIIVLLIFSCDGEPTVPQVHYYHDNSAICARFCYSAEERSLIQNLAGGAAIMATAGILFFKEPISFSRIGGICLALIGLLLLKNS